MVLGPRTGSIRRHRAVTGSQDQGPLLVYIQGAAIIENKTLTRTNFTRNIQFEFRVRGPDSQIAIFGQTHLLFVIATEEVADAESQCAACPRYLPVSAIMRDHGRGDWLIGANDRQRGGGLGGGSNLRLNRIEFCYRYWLEGPPRSRRGETRQVT